MLTEPEFAALKRHCNGFFFSHTGELVNDPWDVRPEHISLHQVARNLGRICRYVGNGDHFYSVAEHCVELSYKVPAEFARDALFHDATEVFLGDLHSLLKRLMHENGDDLYNRLEAHLYATVISPKFGVEPAVPDAVHAADKAFQTQEIESLFKGGPYQLAAWTPEHAAYEFVHRARELGVLEE